MEAMAEAEGNPMLELDDIQGLIVRPYPMPSARYLFLQIHAAERGRRWLAASAGEITTARPWSQTPSSCVNVGLSYCGLAALGLPEAALATFPDPFREGM